MINLISKIFEEAGLEEKKNEDFKVYALKGQKNFWVIIHYDNDDIDKVIDQQIDLFVKVREMLQEPTFDKNANLIVLNRVQKISDIKLDNVLQIEENPYHFKKCVLYYTKEELDNLIDSIEEPVLSSIESMILVDEIFEQHKMHFNDNSFESLIYRIAIKIPFVKINIAQTNNLKSLEEINKKTVQNDQFNDLLENDYFMLDDEDFNAMTDEAILEKFKTILPDENQQN